MRWAATGTALGNQTAPRYDKGSEMTNLWKAEPTLLLSAVSAGIALLLAFGVPVTKEQMGAIMAFVAAVLGLINRAQVTSPASLQNMTPKDLATAQDAAQPVKDITKKLPIVLVALMLGSSMACASAPPNLTPQATQAFYNTRVTKVLDLLRETAVSAHAQTPPIVSTLVLRRVTMYHESSIKIMHAAGSGWQPAVLTGLDELTKDVTPAEKQILAPYVALAKTILQEVR
jgi:hypothetical protein